MRSKHILAMSALLISACTGRLNDYTQNYQFDPNGGRGKLSCNEARMSDFATVKSRVLENSCMNCHAHRDMNHEWISANLTEMDSEIRTGRMPKDRPPLSALDKELVLDWLACGAPLGATPTPAPSPTPVETPTPTPIPEPSPSPTPDPGTSPTPEVVNFQRVHDAIFAPKCVKCHAPGESAELYDFTSYVAIQLSSDIFNLQNPEASKIIEVTRKQGRGQMPPVKSGIPRLTEDEDRLLLEWIRQGTQE